MNRFFIVTYIILLNTTWAFAQEKPTASNRNVKVIWGPDIEIPNGFEDLYFYKDKSNKLYYLNLSKEKLINFSSNDYVLFTQFDNSFKTKKKDTLKVSKKFTREHRFQDFLNIGGEDYFFHSKWIKSEKTDRLFAERISTELFQSELEKKSIMEIDKHLGKYEPESGWFNFHKNNDNDLLLVTYNKKLKIKTKDGNTSLAELNLFDKKLNLLWRKEMEMPFPENEIKDYEYRFDKEGNVYLILERKLKIETERNKYTEVLNYELFRIGLDTIESIPINLNFNNTYLHYIQLLQNKRGNLQLFAIYSNRAKGICGIGSAEFVNGVFTDFIENTPPEGLRMLFESSKTTKQMDHKKMIGEDAGINFRSFDLYENDDGTFTFLAEESIDATFDHLSGNYFNNGTLNCLDIYVTYLDSTGKMIWAGKIPKEQEGAYSPNLMSYCYNYYKGNHYFLFNDNSKNMNLYIDDGPAMYTNNYKGMLTAIRLDKEGNMYRQNLFDIGEIDKTINPNKPFQIAPNKIVFDAFRNNEHKLVLFQFGDD